MSDSNTLQVIPSLTVIALNELPSVILSITDTDNSVPTAFVSHLVLLPPIPICKSTNTLFGQQSSASISRIAGKNTFLGVRISGVIWIGK
jgi:hypothetical protein